MSVVTGVLRSIRVRPRLAMSMAIGLSVLLLLPHSIAGPTRVLAAWDVGAGLYLALAWTMMARGSVEKMRWRAKRQDDGALAVLTLTITASVASLAAIVLELIGIKNQAPGVQTSHIALAMATILCSCASFTRPSRCTMRTSSTQTTRRRHVPAWSFRVARSRTILISCTSRSSLALRPRLPTSTLRPARCAVSRSPTVLSLSSLIRRCWH